MADFRSKSKDWMLIKIKQLDMTIRIDSRPHRQDRIKIKFDFSDFVISTSCK